MSPATFSYQNLPDGSSSVVQEDTIEYGFIGKLQGLNYEYRPHITNRATLEANFREKFQALNRVHLTDSEFARLLDEIITPDVFTASKTLRAISSFTRDDGTPLNFTLVNIKDWCKNTFEVIDQMTNDKVRMTNRVSRTLTLDTRTSKFGSFDIRNSAFDISPQPYQVYAVKHMVTCTDDDNGNGYIWHTTGSGKTLTSFKAATLLKENEHIHKCVFVVDRKDLDRQTREEFNRFQKGCVEENTNTAALVRRLLSEDYADKVIVTTTQKLGLALDENSKRNKQRSKNDQATFKEQLAALSDVRIVFIFDECHRSQFGENHVLACALQN